MKTSELSKVLRRSTLAAGLLAMIAPAGFAYHLFYLQSGGSYFPTKWTTTANFTVGSSTGATDITAEVSTAADAWKNITTAQSPLGTFTAVAAEVRYNGANFGTAWGVLTGDGKQEVIFDEDGSAFAALGLDPGSVNGYGPSHARIIGGAAVIDDAFLLLNGTRTNFDRQSTETHELGHIQGLAHSAIGMYNSASINGEFGAMAPGGDVLDPISVGSVPTMHPFSVNTGTSRRTPKADDIAALSELYPTATFTSTLGSISGTVTRCVGGAAITGANVRAVNTANTNIQVGRFSGYDGNTAGSYVINGVPPGTYRVLIEGLGANGFTLDRFTTNVPVKAENDFATEYYNAACGADFVGTRPGTPANTGAASPVAAIAGGIAGGTNLKVAGVDLAFVIDNTGSMSNEISAVRVALAQFITDITAASTESGRPFPTVAIVPFIDTPSVQVISNNPATLQSVVAAQRASGGGDCPEPSNSAVLTAGRLLRRQGVAILFTDADSDYDGPSQATVDSYYRSKGLRLSVLLSGSCGGGFFAVPSPLALIRGGSRNAEYSPDAPLGGVDSVATFVDESLTSGGIFDMNTAIKSGDSTGYTNTITNIAESSVLPAVGLVNPVAGPRGATMTVTITGQNTNFTAGSTVGFSGTGVAVNSVAVLSATVLTANITIDPAAALTFRDVTVISNLGGGTTQTATGGGAFQVTAAELGATITSATPVSGAQGQTLVVQLWGVNTHFAGGVSVVDFGTGITVNSVAVHTPTSLTANISISSEAAIGFRSVAVTTTGEIASDTGNGSFLVTPPAPLIAVISSITPHSGEQGQSGLSLAITGQNTHFSAGTSLLSFSNAGIAVTGLTIESPTSATATVTIDPGATLGFSDVLMTTGGEGASLLSGFQVVPSSGPVIPPVVHLLPQSVALEPIPNHAETDPPFTVHGLATSGLPLKYVIAGPATINGNTVTITGMGVVTVEAYQDGAGVYEPGSAFQSFTVTLGTPEITSVANAATMKPGPLAPDSFGVIFGSNLATGTAIGHGQTMNGAAVKVTDSSGKEFVASLWLVSYKQINFLVPAGVATGPATLTVLTSTGQSAAFPVTIATISPGIFTANSSGSGMPAAQMFMMDAEGNMFESTPYACFEGVGCNTAVPMSMAGMTQAWVTLYGTGIRGRTDLAGIHVTIGSHTATVLYAGPQGTLDGLDQVNVSVPMSLTGAGMVNVTMTVDGVTANTVTLDFK